MAKHRELASVVSAKIWKTVVFSGAMLAASPALADTAKKDSDRAEGQYKMVKAPEPGKEVRTAEQITADLTDRDARVKAQIDLVVAATTPEERAAGKAELDRLDKERKTLRAELKALKLRPATPTSAGVTRAELALSTNEAKQVRLAGTIATAKTDKARDAAKLQLVAAQKDREKLEAKLVVAKEDAAKPRPRTPAPELVRPKGRGFILS